MGMRPVVEAERLTKLTEDDLALIFKVFEVSAVKAPGEQRPGIITVKGPETLHLFEDVPGVKTASWAGFVRGGETGAVKVKGPNGMESGVPNLHKRRFERFFVGSLVWPQGVPIGVWDVWTPRAPRGGDYKPHNSIKDISDPEFRHLKALAMGLSPMTDRQRKRDEIAKENARAAAQSPDANSAIQMFTKALGAAAALSQETEVEKAVEERKVPAPERLVGTEK